MNRLEILASTLNASDLRRFKNIYAPTVVGVQPEDSRRSLVVMPDGEIRSYGIAEKTSTWGVGKRVYLSSRNCGLDWKLCYPESDSVLGSATKLPWSNRWIVIPEGAFGQPTYAYLSDIGPDDPNPRKIKVDDRHIIDMFLPEAFEDKHRVLCIGHIKQDNGYDTPIVFITDDDGESWTEVTLNSAPKHEAVFPHRGVRWQNTSTETAYTRLADGRLMLLARTSLDYLYVYYSSDLGDSWTDGEPSEFHCTLTTPFLLKLHDGRTVFFWNNTRPLPELDHDTQYPPIAETAKNGTWEDVFTNRDANHAAISDDCVNWIGFRELALNEIRNAADYRVKGGVLSSADKSVHQFQAIELPYNKVLVEYGQHEISRRIVIFDLDWLYDKTRVEDWQYGLRNVSTHMYVKSICESHIHTGFAGHCAWNRTDGALLIPDPDITWGECLQLCRVHDERLFNEKQGMVWNFPMARKGELKLQLRIAGAGAAVRLCDHWINPCDKYVGHYALFDFELDSTMMTPDVWHEVTIGFDCDAQVGEVFVDGNPKIKLLMKNPAPQGVSYLHMQSLAESVDFKGTLIRRIEYKGE